jgi:transposase
MELLYTHCCGIDVHKRSISVCVVTPGQRKQPNQEVRQFGTMTGDLLALADWLRDCGVTHVAMESTGVYWKPVWNILETEFEIVLVNASHIKQVPGKKTDTADCIWIADLLRHGLLKPSFVPKLELRELRGLCRSRTTLVRQRAALSNRIQKLLEDANIKLAAVATNVLGTSAKAMLRGMLGGETDANRLAELAQGRLREKLPQLREALTGHLTDHHRFLLARLLHQVEFYELEIAAFEAEIDKHTTTFGEAVKLLDAIPGVDRVVAWTILAEIGKDMNQFPTARHLTSWAGLCPGNHESAGKRASGRTRNGSPWLRAMIVQTAWAASHSKTSYLAAQYRRLAARRGTKRALVALACTILVIIWHILKFDRPYQDLGPDYLDRLKGEQARRYYTKRLQRLGWKVTLEPAVG